MNDKEIKLQLIQLCYSHGLSTKEVIDVAKELLEFVMLDDANNKPPGYSSGITKPRK